MFNSWGEMFKGSILKPFLFTLLGVSTSTMALQAANADVIIKEKTRYYKVTGSNGEELYRSMADNGPDTKGKPGNVLASTNFKFEVKNYIFEVRGNRCVVDDVDILVDVTYTYPRWAGSRKASKATKRAWKNFSELAVWHEKQHVRITKEFAEAYEKALRKSKRFAHTDCQRGTLLENFRINRAAIKHERLHRRFDRTDLKPGGRGYEALLGLLKAK